MLWFNGRYEGITMTGELFSTIIFFISMTALFSVTLWLALEKDYNYNT